MYTRECSCEHDEQWFQNANGKLLQVGPTFSPFLLPTSFASDRLTYYIPLFLSF